MSRTSLCKALTTSDSTLALQVDIIEETGYKLKELDSSWTLRYQIKREHDVRREIVGKVVIVLVNTEDINKFLFPIWVSAK
jgi:hypothetical protein